MPLLIDSYKGRKSSEEYSVDKAVKNSAYTYLN